MAEDVTDLLQRWRRGDEEALGDLVPLVYADLRRLARRALSHERPGHTLQPTALVHEAFVRLVPQQAKAWQNRGHFYAVCASVMRQVLVDHARRRQARKRGKGGVRVALEEAGADTPAVMPRDVELLHVDRALGELAQTDPALARLVEMRYFAGMTLAEIGAVDGRAEWDVKKDWKLARAWLARWLEGAPA
ncbi:MAG TPA: sigma-70 family RNA polymerase sigma factor [Vicinamibacteria bacterium]|jgi:RNA polymerase sigma factor (TIGR02999 family)